MCFIQSPWIHLATELADHMDNLKSDLKSVQGVIADLLTRLGGDLSAASWRFPERLAASLDPHQVLKERERENEGLGDNRQLLLELLVDR